MKTLPETNDTPSNHWTLIRDILVLQAKLLVDSFRDLVLIPASLIAGIVSLVRTRDGEPGPEFYTLVEVGQQSERWINLFGAMKNAPPDIAQKDHFGEVDMDEIVGRIETFLVDEHKRGGVTAQAKDRIDKALHKMQSRHDK
jgi:hypothetical protein